MTIHDIRPTLGTRYRHRDTGDIGLVLTWRTFNPQLVVLLCDDGPREMTQRDFWEEWIHADLYDPSRN